MEFIETLVSQYIAAWRALDVERLLSLVDDQFSLVEVSGRAIHGRQELRELAEEWRRIAVLEQWTVVRLVAFPNGAVCEWRFAAIVRGKRSEFDGCSVFEVRDGRLCAVRDYQRSARRPDL